jgi:TolA-binding protein
MLRTAALLLTVWMCPAWVRAQTPAPAPPPNEMYLDGFRFYQEGLFEQAGRSFERFLTGITEEPLRESAWYFLARSRAAVDSANVIRYYDEYIARYAYNRRSAELLIEAAHLYARNEAYLMAAEHFERALTIPIPDDLGAQVSWWRAEAYVSLRDNDAAIQAFLDLQTRYPRSAWAPKALYSRARLYLREARFAETTEAFELLRQRYPFDPMTRRVGTALGESYFQQARYADAIAALRGTLPTLDDAFAANKAVYLIAESHNALEELDEAATWYLRLANQSKGTEQERNAHYGLGWVYHKQQIYHWAAQAFGRVGGTDDELARKALYYKAVNEKLAGRYDLALATFADFGARYKTGAWVETAYIEWAVATFEVGDKVSTIRTLLELIRTGIRLENPGQAYTLLGEAYFANNEFGRSLDAFGLAEQLGEVDPFIPWQARFQRAWVMFQNQAYRDAQRLFTEVYEHDKTGVLAAESLFWSADAWFMLGDYDRAAAGFRTFLQEFPRSEFAGAARYSLGWSFFSKGDYEGAIPPLRQFLDAYRPPPIALFPYDIDTQLRVGDAYYALKQYRDAIRFYELASASDRGGDYALYQIANSYYRSEQTYEAVQTFRRLLRLYPQSRLREQAMYNIGYLYFLAGNFAQAIEEFETLTRQYRGSNWSARAQYNIGDAYYNAGEHAKAIQAYQRVLDLYPNSTFIIEAVNGIQYAMLAAGQADRSSQVLEAFIEKNPQANTADRLRFRQSETILRSGDYTGAIEAFRQYIRTTTSPTYVPEAWYNIADAYRQLGQPVAAITAYETLVREYPRSSRAESALLNLGTLQLENDRAELAVRYFQDLLQRTRRLRNESNIGLGHAYLALSRYAEAEMAYRAVLAVSATNDQARLGLGNVMSRTNRGAEAENLYRAIAASNTLEPGAEAQYRLGTVLQVRRDYPAAVEAYAKVVVLYEAYERWVAPAMIRSAECLHALGNTAESRRMLQTVIDRYPGTSAAEEARRLLN